MSIKDKIQPQLPKQRRKFYDTFAKLAQLVKKTRIAGEWMDMPDEQKQFRTYTGGILNWWPNTGTVTFQGQLEARRELEERFDAQQTKSNDSGGER